MWQREHKDIFCKTCVHAYGMIEFMGKQIKNCPGKSFCHVYTQPAYIPKDIYYDGAPCAYWEKAPNEVIKEWAIDNEFGSFPIGGHYLPEGWEREDFHPSQAPSHVHKEAQ